MHKLAWETKIIYCLESLSMLTQFTYMIVIMQEKIEILRYLIDSFSRGIPSFLAFIVILIMIIFGMAIC